MSKSRRGKSASANELSKWEADLIQAPFNEVSILQCFPSICRAVGVMSLFLLSTRSERLMIYILFNRQETWRSCVYLIVPNKLEDNVLIDVLSEVVATGLRKLFSIITFDGLVKDVSQTSSF